MTQSLVSALLAAIAGEEAAAYAYGLAAPRLSSTQGDLARGGLVAHRLRIIALRQKLAPSDQPAAAGGFTAPTPVDADQAAALLGSVESRLAAVYADLAAASSGDERREAVLAARECSVRSVAWGTAPQAFPGR